VHLERSRESRQAGVRLRLAPGLDLDGRQSPSRLDNEIHFVAALAPVGHRARSRGGRVGEVCTNGRLHQSSP